MNGEPNLETILSARSGRKACWASAFQEAYSHSIQALADMRRVMPTTASPLLWSNLFIASNAACLTERFIECEALARESIQALGLNPPDRSSADGCASESGLSLAGQGRRAEALPLIEQALRLNDSLKRRPLYTATLEAARKKAAE